MFESNDTQLIIYMKNHPELQTVALFIPSIIEYKIAILVGDLHEYNKEIVKKVEHNEIIQPPMLADKLNCNYDTAYEDIIRTIIFNTSPIPEDVQELLFSHNIEIIQKLKRG